MRRGCGAYRSGMTTRGDDRYGTTYLDDPDGNAASPEDGGGKPDERDGEKLGYFGMAKAAVTDFLADDAMTQAAAVAFYTALSFAPLLLLTIFLIGSVLGQGTADKIIDEVQSLVGAEAGESVQMVREQAEGQTEKLSFTSAGGIIALAALVFSASGVFAQLQAAMNQIWDVEQKPGGGVMSFLRARGLSVGIVFAIIFLLLTSLVVTTILSAVLGALPGGGALDFLWQAVNFLVSLAVYVALFALIFKYLPDAKVPWRACWFGAAVTAVLFAIGKTIIGLYLSNSNPAEGFGGAGGAGAIVVLLVWVYYSAIIVFLGAEFTQVWAKNYGHTIVPDKHAQLRADSRKDRPAAT